jgi:hypothetical protein
MSLRFVHLGISTLLLGVACTHHPDPGEGSGARLPRIAFSELDENEDGSVDAEEFERVTAALFERLDGDRDRRLSEEEYEKLLERPRRHGRRGGSRGGWPEGGGWPGGGGGPY